MAKPKPKPKAAGKFHVRYVDKLREQWPHGKALFDSVKKRNGRRALLSFSGGKDSCAVAIELMKHYDEVVPFFMYIVPGMSFVDETMDYYERHLFKRRIRQAPHPGFLRWTRTHLYADPLKAAIIDEVDIPPLTIADIEAMVRESEGLPEDGLVATGVRAEDNPIRAMAIKRYGPITLTKKKWHPLWDWSKQEVVDAISKAGLALSSEYDWMPRSFSGIHAGYLAPIKKHAPKDYQKILEHFPLVDCELWRYERAGLA